MTGLTQARNVTVSADAGQIDVSGTIDAHGATPGQINLWAGTNLILEASAVLNARGQTADANGRGRQVLLAASQEGNQQGTLVLNVGATIGVTAVGANSIDTGPVLGGQVTFVTSRNATNDGVLLSVNIRPGIVIKNSGSITIQGDSQNPNGIDLSGSAYSGSVLNTGDPYSLAGHFGQYDEPIVLAMRAGGNLNFGSCTGGCLSATSAAAVTLGSLSDGFWQYYASAKVVRRSIQLR